MQFCYVHFEQNFIYKKPNNPLNHWHTNEIRSQQVSLLLATMLTRCNLKLALNCIHNKENWIDGAGTWALVRLVNEIVSYSRTWASSNQIFLSASDMADEIYQFSLVAHGTMNGFGKEKERRREGEREKTIQFRRTNHYSFALEAHRPKPKFHNNINNIHICYIVFNISSFNLIIIHIESDRNSISCYYIARRSLADAACNFVSI